MSYRYDAVKIPTREENRELVRRAQAGDLAARNECILRNMPLVRKMATRYARGRDFEDVLHVGVLGLAKAIERFSLDSGNAFTTYAVWWLKESIMAHAAEDSLIRIPAWHSDGRAVPKELKKKAHAARNAKSITRNIDVPAPTQDEPDELPDVHAAMRRLDKRTRDMVKRWAGMGHTPQYWSEIAAEYGVSRQRIEQIRRKAFAKMRRHLEAATP